MFKFHDRRVPLGIPQSVYSYIFISRAEIVSVPYFKNCFLKGNAKLHKMEIPVF